MRRNIQLAVACVVTLMMAAQLQASPIIVDQSNSPGDDFGGFVTIIGQSFTPALTSIDAAEFSLFTTGLGPGTTTAQLDVFDGLVLCDT